MLAGTTTALLHQSCDAPTNTVAIQHLVFWEATRWVQTRSTQYLVHWVHCAIAAIGHAPVFTAWRSA